MFLFPFIALREKKNQQFSSTIPPLMSADVDREGNGQLWCFQSSQQKSGPLFTNADKLKMC